MRLNKLSEVMSSSKNFELYRKLVAEERSSHVPFIGLFKETPFSLFSLFFSSPFFWLTE